MSIKEIITELLNHEISKSEAINMLEKHRDSFRNKNSLEFEVESTGFTMFNNHGILKLKIPYYYEKMKKIKAGDKVDVMLIH